MHYRIESKLKIDLVSINVEPHYNGGPGAATFTINLKDKLIMTLDPQFYYGMSDLEIEF